MLRIITNICLEICKKHVPPKKSPRKHQIPRDRMTMMIKSSKLRKNIQKATNHQTKVNVLNQIFFLLKNINKCSKKMKRNEINCCYEGKPHISSFTNSLTDARSLTHSFTLVHSVTLVHSFTLFHSLSFFHSCMHPPTHVRTH